jgi:amino acid adenylation domain-containing protein
MTEFRMEGGEGSSAACLHELFEACADRAPEAVAVVSGDERLSYRELDARANQVAHVLRSLGVGAESLVGLCMGRSPELLVGLLGILKAGGAYVPLDPSYPAQRLAFMLEDARISVLLTQRTVEAVLPGGPVQVLRLGTDRTLAELPRSRPGRLPAPGNLAYALYTSGSTGRPKGVLIEHRSLLNLARMMERTFELTPDSHILQYASPCFDVSVWEFLAAWLSGGTLHLMPPDARLPGPALLRLLREHTITHAALPPSVLVHLPDAELPSLRVLVSTGEACPASVAARWSAGRRFFNAYGPTEATVHATLFEGSSGEGPPPIGRPFLGMSAHVLDAELEPVAPSLPGELYIGGLGLARGYLHRPELTAERFIPHPVTGERLYRTGDLVRARPDGVLEFLGRMDHQVKIRGHRVEPGEVETLLARHPAVRSVVVVGREDIPGAPRLVAYLVVRPGSAPGPSEWHRFAREVLPEYMVPTAFVELPTLPLSSNGKVDRQALPTPGRGRPALASSFRPPLTPLQRTLESLWSQVLGVTPVGLDDDFLELGGDSLRAAAFATGARDALGVELHPHEVLAMRTIARLSERIESSSQGLAVVPPLLPAAPRPEVIPLSFAQQRLWFLDRLVPGSAAYNLPFLLRFSGPLHIPSLSHGLEALVGRHEALRTTFPLVGSEPVQRIAPPAPLPLPLLDWRPLPAEEREGRLVRFAREVLSRPFDLGEGPLLRMWLICLGETEHVLLLALHHTVCDGASMDVWMKELAALYESFLMGEPVSLPMLPVQYADSILWQRERLQGPTLETGLAFWTQALEGAPHVLDLPIDRPRRNVPTFRGATRALQLVAPATRVLDALARAEGATPFMALLAVLGVLLHRCTGSEDILIGTPVAGRNRSELERLMGFFVNTLALRVQLQGDPTFRELLVRVRERSLAAYAHQDVPFEKVVERLRPERGGGYQPLFQVMLAPQRLVPDRVTRGGLRLSLSEVELQTAPFELTWNLRECEGGGVEGTLLYDSDLFEPSTIDRLIVDLEAVLEEVCAAPDRRLSQLECPGLWDLPRGARTAEMEAALLTMPGVEDCAVRIRRTHAIPPVRVAYVASSHARFPGLAGTAALPPHLRPELLVPVHALPLTPRGRVDEAALQRLCVLDEEYARQWEAHLRQQPGMGEVVVAVSPLREPPSSLHLSEVLPGVRAESPARPAPATPRVAATPVQDSSLVAMAFSDGGPLSTPEDAPRTLVEALVRTAAMPGERGITFIGPEGVPNRHRYAELLHEARCVLTGLRAQGLRPGARVLLQLESHWELCTAFWACVLGGFTPAIIAVAPAYEPHNVVAGKLRAAWELLGHPPLLTSARLAPSLRAFWERLSLEAARLVVIEELRSPLPAEQLHPARPDEVAFLQLSSGSTGMPKCIQETHEAVIHHFHMDAHVHGLTPEDASFNWLPFDHIAPLLNCHLCAIYLGFDQLHAPTEWILADPLRWLDVMETHRVTYSWAPNFAFKLVSDALRRAPHRSWNLGRLAHLVNAGEQVSGPVVRDFLRLVAPFGVQPHVLHPAFGMAELCTGVTYQTRFELENGVHRVAKSSLGGQLEMKPFEDAFTLTFVELGPPSPGVQLRIVDADNRLLPEGFIGRLQVRGRVVTPGYLHNETANREAFVGDGWFNTGDSGFLLDGRLTLTGREKELIIVRGAHLYCHEIEDLVCTLEGVEPTHAGVCGVDAASLGTEGFAIFFTPRRMELEECSRLVTAIRARVTATLGVTPTFVVPVPREEFPRTTSGKIQRGALKQALASGRFARTLEALDLHQGNANTLPHWFYRRVWRPREAVARAPAPEGTYLLFLDAQGLGARLCEALRVAGRRCVTVEPGTEFIREGPDAFRLPPGEPGAYQRVLATLAGEGSPLAQVLHLWTFEGHPPESPTEARERGVFSLLLLSQALARGHAGPHPLRLQVVSSHAQPTTPGEEVDCEKALLLGLLQSIPQEVPWLDARHLDLPRALPEENVPIVLRELAVLQRDREVAWRDGRRLVPRLERVESSALGKRRPPFEAGGVYLLSGGLGSLAVELSRRLLEHYQARLLLVGRTPLDAPHAQERHEALRELVALAARCGGEVSYAAVDICEPQALEELVSRSEARWGRPLDGVLHLAGVLEERVLAEETLEHFTEVLRPKVEGTRALERLLSGRTGAFFVGFSSVNGVFGGFSVSAYASANRFLEHFTLARRGAEGSRHFCFSWSQWERSGRELSEAEVRLANARGYQTLSSGRGWTSLLVGLGHEPGHLLIGLDARSPFIRVRMEGGAPQAQQLCAFFTHPSEETFVSEAPPLDVRDRFGTAVPNPLRHRVEHLPRTATGAVDREALGALDAGPRRAVAERVPLRDDVERKVAALWREALGVEEIGALDNFFELGGHSLLLAQLHARLERDFGRAVPVLELFRHPTVRALSAYLSGQQAARTGSTTIEQRALKQRAAQERHRSRRGLTSRMGQDE